VHRALRPLVEGGIVTAIGHGSGVTYRLDEKHPFAEQLLALFDVERNRKTDLFAALQGWARVASPHPLALWLFGSVARRQDTFRSDIDLAVIGTDSLTVTVLTEGLRDTLAPLVTRYALRTSIVGYTGADIASLPDADENMWGQLLRDVIPLFGPSPERLRNLLLHEEIGAYVLQPRK